MQASHLCTECHAALIGPKRQAYEADPVFGFLDFDSDAESATAGDAMDTDGGSDDDDDSVSDLLSLAARPPAGTRQRREKPSQLLKDVESIISEIDALLEGRSGSIESPETMNKLKVMLEMAQEFDIDDPEKRRIGYRIETAKDSDSLKTLLRALRASVMNIRDRVAHDDLETDDEKRAYIRKLIDHLHDAISALYDAGKRDYQREKGYLPAEGDANDARNRLPRSVLELIADEAMQHNQEDENLDDWALATDTNQAYRDFVEIWEAGTGAYDIVPDLFFDNVEHVHLKMDKWMPADEFAVLERFKRLRSVSLSGAPAYPSEDAQSDSEDSFDDNGEGEEDDDDRDDDQEEEEEEDEKAREAKKQASAAKKKAFREGGIKYGLPRPPTKWTQRGSLAMLYNLVLVKLARLGTVTRLVLNENRLDAVPSQLIRLTTLRWLELTNTKGLPTGIGALVNLAHLTLHYTKIEPDDVRALATLPALRSLDLMGQLLPPNLSSMRLEKLGYGYASSADVELIAKATSLRHLSLTYNDSTFPTVLFNLVNLEVLSYTGSQTQALTAGWPKMRRLTMKNLSWSYATDAAFAQMPDLRSLYWSAGNSYYPQHRRPTDGLFNSIKKMQHLEELTLQYCRIVSLGTLEEGDLPRLRTLDLSNNEYTLDARGALQSLVYLASRGLKNLVLDHNQLVRVPMEILANAPELESLSLAQNRIDPRINTDLFFADRPIPGRLYAPKLRSITVYWSDQTSGTRLVPNIRTVQLPKSMLANNLTLRLIRDNPYIHQSVRKVDGFTVFG